MKRTITYNDFRSGTLKPAAGSGVDRFNFINHIEIELDGLINEFEQVPTLKKYKTIQRKIDLGLKLSDNLMKFPTEIDYYTDRFTKNLSLMIDAFHIMNEKAQAIAEQIPAQKKTNSFSYEQTMLPSIHNYVSLISSQLHETLKQDEVIDKDQLQQIIDLNAKELATQLYSAEKNSMAVKKLEGLSSHYLQLAQDHEQLHDELLQLQSDVKSLQTVIICEKEASETTQILIQQLQDELQKNQQLQDELQKNQQLQDELQKNRSAPHYDPEEVNKLIEDNTNYKLTIAEMHNRLKAIENTLVDEQNSKKTSHSFFHKHK